MCLVLEEDLSLSLSLSRCLLCRCRLDRCLWEEDSPCRLLCGDLSGTWAGSKRTLSALVELVASLLWSFLDFCLPLRLLFLGLCLAFPD